MRVYNITSNENNLIANNMMWNFTKGECNEPEINVSLTE